MWHVQPPEPSLPVAPSSAVAAMRRHYTAEGLDRSALADEPMEQFDRWFAEVAKSGLDEPNAMVVSTADAEGRPSVRTVLLKGYDRRGFVFYTNHGSRKGTELDANPQVALLFPWHPLSRQVIVQGRAERVGRQETAAYFRSRPHGSQLGAWASEQSRPIDSREELEQRYADLADRYPEGEDVPVPPFWGGYRVTPASVEFWQGRENRLHDRLRYEREDAAAVGEGWTVQRLCP
ncbi:pyridoxamine 5'-phosphate oxidase [Streptacidiphilus sp. PAMC 29251]